MRNRGKFLLLFFAGIVASASVAAVDVLAQGYPAKPVRVLVGFSPGSGADAAARTVAPKLSERLGQTVVIENRLGAGGSIATETASKSPADGYTLLMMAGGDAIRPALRTNLPYDLVRDFAQVSMVTIGLTLLAVHPSVPARNVEELIALARSQPGKLNYGSAGVGSSAHLAGVLFNLMAKVDIVHVPFKGGTENLIATVAGQIDMSFAGAAAAVPLLGAGKLRALAITSAKRSSVMPSIPTLDESGVKGYDRSTWFGLVAPAGVPKDIITRLNKEIVQVVNTREVTALLQKQSFEPRTSTPEEFAAFIRSEIAQNIKLIKLSGIKTD